MPRTSKPKAKTKPRDHGAALFLSQMPPETLRLVKAKATADHYTLKAVIIQLMELYLQKGKALFLDVP